MPIISLKKTFLSREAIAEATLLETILNKDAVSLLTTH